jgi:chemotaxis protein MotB
MPPPFRMSRGAAKRRGGSWKVAYADFVTAMMALFIVLWMMNTSQRVQRAVSAYFRDPKGHGKVMGEAEGGDGRAAGSVAIDPHNVQELKKKLEQAIGSLPEIRKLKKQVQISITPEGLRVELLETERGLFFESGRPEPSSSGVQMLGLLAGELGRLSNDLVIEGHTDARPYRFSALNGYGNWELSVDRANAARRCMQEHGLSAGQVVQIRGFSDKRPLDAANPNDSRNRRISVVVEYNKPQSIGPPEGAGLP